ncbi:hypothetical protein QA640_06950 [Bradyrhizobium sp. CB82]|uniref:hypothetical protein n=1 Tax=Bradyrhizobium sp. CB82 TaxID=3039159 RepID=UPI0024B05139|nr:hypothetical protein [Bradyrhizobium sp. CB82]WFU42209.1 hypothetical protein QA640_06950 [Bradyrhizobium sp. CB82]
MSTTYEDVRAQLGWLCDAMIPGDNELGMPSARAAGVLETLLPRALKARPDLAPRFYEIVSKLPAEKPRDPLAFVNAIPVEEMDVVGRFVAGAYFSGEEVSKNLGFTGFQALPMNPDYDEIMETVGPIIARGPCYVKV